MLYFVIIYEKEVFLGPKPSRQLEYKQYLRTSNHMAWEYSLFIFFITKIRNI